MKGVIQMLAFLWASPYTLAGLLLGGLGLCTGGRARVRGRIVEFYGGGIKWLIHRLPDVRCLTPKASHNKAQGRRAAAHPG